MCRRIQLRWHRHLFRRRREPRRHHRNPHRRRRRRKRSREGRSATRQQWTTSWTISSEQRSTQWRTLCRTRSRTCSAPLRHRRRSSSAPKALHVTRRRLRTAHPRRPRRLLLPTRRRPQVQNALPSASRVDRVSSSSLLARVHPSSSRVPTRRRPSSSSHLAISRAEQRRSHGRRTGYGRLRRLKSRARLASRQRARNRPRAKNRQRARTLRRKRRSRSRTSRGPPTRPSRPRRSGATTAPSRARPTRQRRGARPTQSFPAVGRAHGHFRRESRSPPRLRLRLPLVRHSRQPHQRHRNLASRLDITGTSRRRRRLGRSHHRTRRPRQRTACRSVTSGRRR